MPDRLFLLTLSLLAGLAATAVQAQSSASSCPAGTAYVAGTGCTTRPPSRLLQFGASPNASTNTRQFLPNPGRASDHLTYLGPQCASMLEGIRTGPARGVPNQTTFELQRNYQRDCGEEDALARRKLAEELGETVGARQAERREVIAHAARVRDSKEQCEATGQVYRLRSQRKDLNEAERAEFARFAENFKQRCL